MENKILATELFWEEYPGTVKTKRSQNTFKHFSQWPKAKCRLWSPDGSFLEWEGCIFPWGVGRYEHCTNV